MQYWCREGSLSPVHTISSLFELFSAGRVERVLASIPRKTSFSAKSANFFPSSWVEKVWKTSERIEQLF
jgi:hypothetical protein